MAFIIHPLDFIKACALCHIDFTADNGFNPLRRAGIKKIHGAVHHAVVGHGKRGLPKGFCARGQFFYAAGTIEQTVFGMHMKMGKHYKSSAIFSNFFSLWFTPERESGSDKFSAISFNDISG